MKPFKIFFCLSFAFLLTCAGLLMPGGTLLADEYTVGPDDVLKITVYDHPDMETRVRVDGNGTILMPLIGHVNVAGRSIAQVSDKLASLLGDGYLVNPQVNVFIEGYGSKKAVILGMVNKPGLYELSGQTTLLELISKAGGLASDSGATATIKRLKSGGKSEIITVDMRALMESGDMSQNVAINHKDNVYVAKAGMCFVTGEVKKPDAYKIDEDTTVIKAVTLAAGFTGKAAKSKIRIIRIIKGTKNILKDVELDTPVRPDDVIVVPESFF
ncbi:MAG: polysaccharide biosynthesis/export family protein [Thermodesulfobacteriota bacterium]